MHVYIHVYTCHRILCGGKNGHTSLMGRTDNFLTAHMRGFLTIILRKNLLMNSSPFVFDIFAKLLKIS